MATVNDFPPGTAIAVTEPDDDTPDETELQSLVKRQIDEALSWREEHLDPDMEEATDYYFGRPYGDEEDGRSKIVTTEVRDTVQQMLPSLMRTFVSSERIAEFKPRNPDDVPIAKQQTEYVNYIFYEDNPGFLILHSALKDALVRKMGIVKWWWEEAEEAEGSEHTGLTPDQVAVLETDPNVTITVREEDEETGLLNVAIVRRTDNGKVKIAAVPPEELIFSPGARSKDDATMIGQYQEKSASDLRAMGVPKDMVKKAKGKDPRREEGLRGSRRPDEGARHLWEDTGDESTRPVPFAEVYVKYDSDGDDVAELHRVRTVGLGHEIWTDDIVDSVPFAIFQPDPEPHTMVGLSAADYLMDLQRIKSHITRGMLDSLTASLNPVTEIVDGEVNMKDVLNKEIGRVIRTRKPGMMREVTTPFVGGAALPVLEHLDEQKVDRVGVSRASAGLDPDALQSTTKAAVTATVQAAQQRLELIARIFAETGLRDLMKGLLKLVVQHQDESRVVRLRDNFVRVDPRHWDADKDVVINVALGTGLVEEKIQALLQIAQKQEEHIQQGSPLAGMQELRATYGRIIELMGFRNTQEFFKPFGPQEQQAFAQQQAQAAQNEPPSDTEVLREIEMAKIKARSQEKQAEMRLKLAELELEREKVARELALKEVETDVKASESATQQAIDRAKLEIERATKEIDALQKLSQTQIALPGEDNGSRAE